MNKRRAAVGLCVLCALLISAFAAQSASAVTNGTTAFTCKDTGKSGPGFTKAHCKPSDAGTGNFSHVAIPQDTTTEVEISSSKTNAATDGCVNTSLKSTVGGVSMEITSCDIHGTGWLENLLTGSEHWPVGHSTLTFTNVTTNLPGCKVSTDISPSEMGEEGVIHTEPLRMTTLGQGDAVKIEPTSGSVIARFYLTNCNTASFNATYTISGTFKCVPDGATKVCTHANVTAENTLKLNGATKAGVNGALTVKGRANSGESYTPLSGTTVGT